MANENGYANWIEPTTGIVHFPNAQGVEYTLCSLACDEPSSERGEEMMERTNKVCTCEECKRLASEFYPYLKREIARIRKAANNE